MRKDGHGVQSLAALRESVVLSVQSTHEKCVTPYKYLLDLASTLGDPPVTVDAEAVVAKHVHERAWWQRGEVARQDGCARVEVRVELIGLREFALPQPRVEVVEPIEIARADLDPPDDFRRASAHGLFLLGAGELTEALRAAA